MTLLLACLKALGSLFDWFLNTEEQATMVNKSLEADLKAKDEIAQASAKAPVDRSELEDVLREGKE